MPLGDKIEDRSLRPYHIMVASLFAGLNEMGMLNQASVNVASRRAGRYLSEYASAKGGVEKISRDASRNEKVQALVKVLDTMLELGTRVKVGVTPDDVEIAIVSMGCKFCPKGVGEAELKGALCPYPGMVEEFVNSFLPPEEKVKLASIDRRQLRKQGDSCYMVLR